VLRLQEEARKNEECLAGRSFSAPSSPSQPSGAVNPRPAGEEAKKVDDQ
jgi:hypothetical protein